MRALVEFSIYGFMNSGVVFLNLVGSQEPVQPPSKGTSVALLNINIDLHLHCIALVLLSFSIA